ncbi:unnamed protein product [Gongylonema pulchrum]|uniref:Protein kinase domain-containing protein n=1 Tax=Gongylonema pulchrum TaxID=637853 RepID=A0A183DSB2_9BILA|nr:unnamed protein product [Gongylonema pulchrum]
MVVCVAADPAELATCFWASSDLTAGWALKSQARILKTLRHPNVLAYLDSVEAMTSVLSSFFSRDPKATFPYELPETSFFSFDGISVGKSFKKADPAELATCFWASSDLTAGWALKSQARILKTLRHPNMNGMFYLITEACAPLKTYIDESKLIGKQKNYVVSWGLFQLMNCLKFLHQEAKLSHENVRHSVYVTEGGDWKLGVLVQSFFSKIEDHYVTWSCLFSELRRTDGFFKNRYVDTLLFLDEFQLKDAHEKQIFFTKLKDDLEIFPSNIAKYRILPKVIHSYEYGDAGSFVLVPLFQLGHLLDEEEYQRRVVPCLCKLFSSPDRVTRVKLLEHIDEIAPHLTPQIVNEKIYGNLSSGFADTSPVVRESTIKAIVSLADKLNNSNLNTDLMRHLARLQDRGFLSIFYRNLSSGFADTSPVVRESTIKAIVSLADKLNNSNLNTDLMRHLARLQGNFVQYDLNVTMIIHG